MSLGFRFGRRSWIGPAVAAVVLTLAASDACAQALVVPEGTLPLPRPIPGTGSFSITGLEITARVEERAVDLTVSQTVKNEGDDDLQVRFLFPLTADTSVDGMTLLVDGKEFPAQLLDAETARDRFHAIVREKQDPALLEWSGGRVFQTAVFPVPVGKSRTVTVHATRLLTADFGLADLKLPLSAATITKQPISKLQVTATIEADGLRTVYSPTHPIETKRPSDGAAVVSYSAEDIIPDQDFRLLFDTSDRGQVAGSLLSYRPDDSEDGYFLMIATPPPAETTERVDKTTVMVIDRSGSMNGEKIQQAREATRTMLSGLTKDDLFNLVTYADVVTPLFPELQPAGREPLQKANLHAAGIAAGGGTNIHEALVTSLEQIGADPNRPAYLLFLTDGLPTVGQTDEAAIASGVRKRAGQTRLISFGLGYDVNSRLLDRLSTENRGFSEYVRPNENLEAAISRVTRRLSTPVLTDATLDFAFDTPPKATPINRLVPEGPVDLFAGQELVIVGRYRQPGAVTLTLSGTRLGAELTESFEGELVERSSDSSLAFVEKVWATRRIGQIINSLDLGDRDTPRAKELIAELIALSKKHGILTPYTAFLADEDAPADEVTVREEVERRLEGLDRAAGRLGFGQRGLKQLYADNVGYAAPALSNAVQNESYGYLAEADVSSVDASVSPASGLPGSSRQTGQWQALTQRRPATPGTQPASASPEAAAKPTAPAVQAAGNDTLYRRGTQLRTADTLDVDLARQPAIAIEQFSPDYFEIVAANTSDENAILGRQQAGQDLLVRFRGTLYLIAPAN